MNPIHVLAKVDAEGIVHLDIPVGRDLAHQNVQVTIEPAAPAQEMSAEEWKSWVQSMAGCWQGDFERPPQGVPEERDPL